MKHVQYCTTFLSFQVQCISTRELSHSSHALCWFRCWQSRHLARKMGVECAHPSIRVEWVNMCSAVRVAHCCARVTSHTMVMMASLSFSRRARCPSTARRRSMLATVSPVTCCTHPPCEPCTLIVFQVRTSVLHSHCGADRPQPSRRSSSCHADSPPPPALWEVRRPPVGMTSQQQRDTLPDYDTAAHNTHQHEVVFDEVLLVDEPQCLACRRAVGRHQHSHLPGQWRLSGLPQAAQRDGTWLWVLPCTLHMRSTKQTLPAGRAVTQTVSNPTLQVRSRSQGPASRCRCTCDACELQNTRICSAWYKAMRGLPSCTFK
jgi:hypothetical protein